MRLAVFLLLVAGGVKSETEGEEVRMSDEDAHNKVILVKDFSEGMDDGIAPILI
jgi:hypothetical protein